MKRLRFAAQTATIVLTAAASAVMLLTATASTQPADGLLRRRATGARATTVTRSSRARKLDNRNSRRRTQAQGKSSSNTGAVSTPTDTETDSDTVYDSTEFVQSTEDTSGSGTGSDTTTNATTSTTASNENNGLVSYYFTSCAVVSELYEVAIERNISISPVANQRIAFEYQMVLNTTDDDPSNYINSIEERLNNYMSRQYLGDCSWNSTTFQSLSMSSLPIDQVGTRCSDGTVNCYTIQAAITPQIFYWRAMQNQITQNNILEQDLLSDAVVLESFGQSLQQAFTSGTLLEDGSSSAAHIASLQLGRITNYVADSPTFGGPDSSATGGAAGLVETKSLSEPSRSDVGWAATFLAGTLVALGVVSIVMVRHRRAATQKPETKKSRSITRKEPAMKPTMLDDDKLFTFEDSTNDGEPRLVSSLEPNVELFSLEDDDDDQHSMLKGFVIQDSMTDNDDNMSDFTGVEVESTFRRRTNTNPPIFVRADASESLDTTDL